MAFNGDAPRTSLALWAKVFVASTAPTATAATVLISVIIFVLSFLIAKEKASETKGDDCVKERRASCDGRSGKTALNLIQIKDAKWKSCVATEF